MPNINDINGVTIANLSKLDGVTKANIAKVLGITLEAAAAFLLDTYTGAAAGYSVRRIASSATNLMRIREDSGDTETDIGYDSNGDLDLAAIASHCGTANGFVVSWVDQSSNGNDADQSTNASQPKIYDGTTQAVLTENGKPALDFDGSNDRLIIGGVTGGVTTATAFLVRAFSTYPTAFRTAFNYKSYGITHNSAAPANFGDVHVFLGTSTKYATDATYSTATGQALDYMESLNDLRRNTTQATVNLGGAYGGGQNLIGAWSNAQFFLGNMQELVLWESDQSSNRTGIETNINTEYLIYQPTDAPTSGLLATYTGAAAAYSVRQLSDKAVIAITVRRDSDDEEKRFGFDSNGDLDTTGIADFCTTANGYVSQWWDQSTNGNHATQSTSGSQPQIYNGTAVITENGKPALQLGRSTLKQLTTSAISWSTSFTAATVLQPTDDGNFYIKNWSIGSDATERGYAHIAMTGAGTRDWSRDDSAMFGDGYESTSYPRIITTGSAFTSGQQALSFLSLNSTASTLHVDGSEPTYRVQQTGNTSADSDILYINGGTTAGQGMDGTMQELILWASDESSNRSGIETDINTYFSIYT